MTAKVIYQGGLRCEASHLKSGNSFITDAPVDNHGKGEAFSPTDLLAAALGSCMLTVMGIKAQSWQKDLENSSAEIEKVMNQSPRRVGALKVKLSLGGNFTDAEKAILREVAENCPVAKSLAETLDQQLEIRWL